MKRCFHCDIEIDEDCGLIVVRKIWCSLECLAKIYSWQMVMDHYISE